MNVNVLVIDDEYPFLLALRQYFEQLGMHVETAETFEDAMPLINRQEYDFVITDIRLSGVLSEEGLDILKYLKRFKTGTKVIIITGYGSREILQRAYTLGADFYFEKPVSGNSLVDAMKKLAVE
jgi:DNA-binding NtrC family response regulator